MCADPLPRTPGTEKMAFPDTNSPLPLLSLVFRLSRFHSLELYKSLDVWGQGSVAAPMSRCLWAGLRHYTPGSSFGTSLRTHMKKVVLCNWMTMWGLFSDVLTMSQQPVVPVTHELNLYWNRNRKSLQLSCEKQRVMSFHFALSHQQVYFSPAE